MSMKIQRIRKEDINDDATVSIKEMGILMKYVGVSIKTIKHLFKR